MKRLLALTALVAAGCGDPYANTPKPKVAGEQPAPKLEQPLAETSPARTPAAAARRAAELASNWTGETAAANYGRLARLTTGDARRQAEEAAARLPTDPQLEGTSSEGSVQSISTTPAGDLIVVTRETITANGLRDTRYRVALARATRARDGWLLSRWDPQP